MSVKEKTVQYFSNQAQYRKLEKEIQGSVLEVLRSGSYILSDKVDHFEKHFAQYIGSRNAVGVGSGTDALILTLKALGIGKGDEVIVPSFTFIASVFSIMHVGAVPVFADVDPGTYTIDSNAVEKVITRKTKAVLPVHLYGQTADMSSLMRIARKNKLKVVEDAAQAHGASFDGKLAGSFGDAGCFSFYPTKNLGACGDGGMIVTKSKALAETVRKYRNLGRLQKEDHTVLGHTSRLDALQAVILDCKLKQLGQYNNNRIEIAEAYNDLLKETPVVTPFVPKKNKHVYHLYVVLVPNGRRDKLRKYLAQKSIPTMIHYEKPVHHYPAYTNVYKKKWKLPITERISKEILSLPIYPEMPVQHTERVAEAIRNFYKGIS